MLATQDNSVVISTQLLCRRIPISHLIQEDDIKVDIKETKFDLASPDQAMFCTHLSHFGLLYNCYQNRTFLREK